MTTLDEMNKLEDARVSAMTMRGVKARLLADQLLKEVSTKSAIITQRVSELVVDYEAAVNEETFANRAFSEGFREYRGKNNG